MANPNLIDLRDDDRLDLVIDHVIVFFKIHTTTFSKPLHFDSMSNILAPTIPTTALSPFRHDIIQTDTSPLIQAFPWSTGIPLASDRTQYLKDAFEGKDVPEELLDSLLVNIAQSLANHSNIFLIIIETCSSSRLTCHYPNLRQQYPHIPEAIFTHSKAVHNVRRSSREAIGGEFTSSTPVPPYGSVDCLPLSSS
jgi:hypothetical protein